MTKVTRRNMQDSTLINVRAIKRRVAALEKENHEIKQCLASMSNLYVALAKKVAKAKTASLH